MAGAVSPFIDDATSIYWNPAGLARMESKEVSLSYNSYFEDTAQQFVGYGHPTEHGTFGVGFTMFGVKDIEKRSVDGDADAPDLGSFDTRDLAASFGWGNKRDMGSGALRYGAALKYISSDLEVESAATGAVDLGSAYEFGSEESKFYVSAALLNLGGELKFDEEGDPLPLNFKPGVAWRKDVGRMGNVIAALDADMLLNDGVALVQPGVEWNVHPMFSLRSGYQIGRDEDAGSGFAAGVGFRMSGLMLDYAFVPYGELGDTHRMSVGYRFGGMKNSISASSKKQSEYQTSANGRQQIANQ
jgi:hypothetical protein